MINNSTYEVKVQRLIGWKPKPNDIVEVQYEGDFVTEKFMENSVKGHIRRIDAKTYEVVETGEVREYKENDEGTKALARRAALNRTFEELRALIRVNFVSPGGSGFRKQLFITLTYAENMKDEEQLYKDFKNFIRRLERAYPRFAPFTYIAVMEPQGRGAWHVHLMIKTTANNFFLPFLRVQEIWGHGTVSVNELKSDDLGCYYTAYFTGLIGEARGGDTEKTETGEDVLAYEQSIQTMEQMTGGKISLKKTYIKGRRLDLYPKNFHFFRCSRDVRRPTGDFMLHEKLIDKDKYDLRFEKATAVDKVYVDGILSGEVENLNHIYKATYKRKAIKAQ